jgi:hypothetical protein
MGLGLQEYGGLGPRARGFGGRIPALRAERAKKRGQPDTPTPAATLAPPTQRPAQPAALASKVEQPAAPLTLPATFGARFKDFPAAREANKRLKDDLKKGKPPTDRRLPIAVDHPALQGRAFTVSPTTPGWPELFARIDQASGRVLAFQVTITRLDPPPSTLLPSRGTS